MEPACILKFGCKWPWMDMLVDKLQYSWIWLFRHCCFYINKSLGWIHSICYNWITPNSVRKQSWNKRSHDKMGGYGFPFTINNTHLELLEAESFLELLHPSWRFQLCIIFEVKILSCWYSWTPCKLMPVEKIWIVIKFDTIKTRENKSLLAG